MRPANKKFYNKFSENSRSQIAFRTDGFQKLTLGAPDIKDVNVLNSVQKFLGDNEANFQLAATIDSRSPVCTSLSNECILSSK